MLSRLGCMNNVKLSSWSRELHRMLGENLAQRGCLKVRQAKA